MISPTSRLSLAVASASVLCAWVHTDADRASALIPVQATARTFTLFIRQSSLELPGACFPAAALIGCECQPRLPRPLYVTCYMDSKYFVVACGCFCRNVASPGDRKRV